MRDSVASLPDPIAEKLRAELAGARFAYLFGSVLTNGFGPESDVDVAADFGKPLAATQRLDLLGRMAAAIGRDADLVDLCTADPVIKMQVLRYGRPLVINDASACHVFAMTAISEYLDLKLDRAGVEAMTARPHAGRG